MKTIHIVLAVLLGGLFLSTAFCQEGPPVKMPKAPSEDAKSFSGTFCQPTDSTVGNENLFYLQNRILNVSYDYVLWVNCPIVRDDVKGEDGAVVSVSIFNSGSFQCSLTSYNMYGDTVASDTVVTAEAGQGRLEMEVTESVAYGYYGLFCMLSPRGSLYSYRIYENQDGYDDMTDYDN